MDVDPGQLPADEQNFGWSGAQNFRFKDDGCLNMSGYSSLITPSVAPYFQQRISNGSNSYYLYAGLNKVYVQYGGTQYNITRQTTGTDVNYTASEFYQWNCAILNGLAVLNNGYDTPQQWGTISTGTKLTALTAWPTSYKANVIRSYKAYLIALDITNATPTRDSSKIKWSNAALPGALPTSWDYSDPTNDAGEISLSDSEGFLVDCLPLNDYNIVYKSTSTYVMSYVGGNTIFSFRKIFPNIGMMAKNCAAAFEGQHFVVTNNDVIVHNGQTYTSVADSRVRQGIFSKMSSAAADRTFVAPNYKHSEMWVCYATEGSMYPNKAAIYNYKTNTWTTRSLPVTPHISCGFLDISTANTWASQSAVLWQDAQGVFDNSLYNKKDFSLTMCVPDDTAIYSIDVMGVTTDNGIPSYAYLERTNLFQDKASVKMVKRVWPQIRKVAGTNESIDIWVGSEMAPGTLTWNGPYAFNINVDDKIDCFVTGKNISVRFSSHTDVIWQMLAFDLDVDIKGKW